jgi:NTE family protein
MSTALVLGGGGPVGMAWESGVLSGVTGAGVDLRDLADLTIGTSAGSAVGVWFHNGVAGADVVGRLEALGSELMDLFRQPMQSAASTPGSQIPESTPMDAMDAVAQAHAGAVASNRAIGQAALHAHTIPETAYVSAVERLVGTQWPPAFRCPATDIDSGELAVWDQHSGVPLAGAIAAACAWPGAFPVVTVARRRYTDGGILDAMNLQLATGHHNVIGISCHALTDPGGLPAGPARQRLATRDALSSLQRQGADVALVEPDSHFLAISEHGGALMDFSRVRAAHSAGIRLGAKVAQRVAQTTH